MGRARSSMARGSLSKDRPLECTVKSDERTFELANNTLTIALQVRLRCSGSD